MLAQGLARHPRFLPGLLAMAKVQRLRGELDGAQLTLRQAAKVRGLLSHGHRTQKSKHSSWSRVRVGVGVGVRACFCLVARLCVPS